jgi:trimethylamine--corrinoid protein Co-methyltransferase
MAYAIMEHARWGQPAAVTNVVQAGASGPVQLAGVMALQLAEVLCGLVLNQLCKPGAPFMYGNSCCPLDMRSGGMGLGSPETAKLFNMGVQMAEFYGLPSRVGGTMTDSHSPDIRAGMEAMMLQFAALAAGTDVVVHAAGILGAYLSMSYEKFLADEELNAMLRRFTDPVRIIPETIDLKAIHEVGPGGQFLTRPETLAGCRTEFFTPAFMQRQAQGEWERQGALRADQQAGRYLKTRLESYVKPDIDPGIEKDLMEFVAKRKAEV